MSFLRAIITLVLTLVVAGFAAMNTEPTEVVFSPVHDPAMIPIYAVALISVAVGFVVGAMMVWINSGSVRKAKRKQKKEIKNLEQEVGRLKDDKFVSRPPATDVFPALPSQ